MKILVIGDSCVDRFVYCDIDRLCPEAPVPVLNPVKRTENPGMAGNVVENLRSLGADVDLLTNSKKISKTRYVDTKTGQMIMRLDESDSCERFDVNQISKDCEYDAVIVSDYNKGFLTELDMETICDMDCFKFLDSKRKFNDFKDGTWCHLFDFIKINSVEYEQNKKDVLDNYNNIKQVRIQLDNQLQQLQKHMINTSEPKLQLRSSQFIYMLSVIAVVCLIYYVMTMD